MLIDSNLVFLDSAEAKTADSLPVPLNSFWKPGRQEPIPICLKIVGGDLTGATSLKVQLQDRGRNRHGRRQAVRRRGS